MIYLSATPTKNNRITSGFGGRPGVGYDGFHSGVDFAPISKGSPNDYIYSVQDGIVMIASYNGNSYGNTVVIEHTKYQFCSLYAHLDNIYVSQGQPVSVGAIIGTMGNSGMGSSKSKPVHLHFELRNILFKNWAGSRGNLSNTKCVDPAKYLKNIGAPVGMIPYQAGYGADTDYASQIPEEYSYERLILDQSKITTYGKLYGRAYRVMVFDKNGDGLDITDLHIRFDCSKSITLENSVSIVSIYNLNALTEGRIIETAERITIEAGYEGTSGLIFDGDVIQAIREKENGTDFRLDIVTMDGDRFINQGFAAFTMTRGQTKRQIIENITNSASNPAKLGSISEAYEGGRYIRGKVVFGAAKDYLNQMAKSEEANFYMENGSVNLVRLQDLPEGEIIKLDSSSGLIGSPRQTDNGVTFKCLLTPRIKINGIVNIDSELVVERQYSDGSEQGRILDKDGTYRIIELTYSGDTRGQDWYVNCTAVSQSAGDLPQMLAAQLR